ncbi:MAG: ArsA family ATPase [Desulfomonilaceae bacterium]
MLRKCLKSQIEAKRFDVGTTSDNPDTGYIILLIFKNGVKLKNKHPRIIIFSGKGGVGKTTVSAATASLCASAGLDTIVISIDIAHSLSDAFQLNSDLHDQNRGKPRQISEHLWMQEVDIQEELDHHWKEVSNYLAALLGSSGMTEVLAEELAIIPGMEDVISLLYINQYFIEKTYDVIIVDCPPTGESLRFIGMPTTLEWYINKVFKWQRNIFRVVRPVAKKLVDAPIPEDSYFEALHDLFLKLEGVDKILLNRDITSIRLVTNAEKIVIRETQRAFMYFCLYGLMVDTIIVNRLFPESLEDGYFKDWLMAQKNSLKYIQEIFDPIPVRTINFLREEVVGLEKLSEMGQYIYGNGNPSEILHRESLYEILENRDGYILNMKLPFVSKEHIDLFKEKEDLTVRIGSFKRHILLPRALVNRKPTQAQLVQNVLSIKF